MDKDCDSLLSKRINTEAMIQGIPRISVLVITYKQEDLIGRTLDSLVSQKDYLYEICVSDDCSPDGTWQVLQEYQRRYPDLIKLHRNDPNVGIFENTEYTWTMPSGDIVNQIAGDDTAPDGWYKTVIEFINNNNIDFEKELFCIYCDHKVQYPNGDSFIIHNHAIGKYPDQALLLALRGLIHNRGCCFSINVMKCFEKVSQGRSHVSEFLQDRQLQIYGEKNYYIPCVGNVYYAGIGVSAHLDDDTIKERRQIRPYAERRIEAKGIKIRRSEKYYGKYISSAIAFRFHKKISDLLRAIWYCVGSFDIHYSFLGNDFRHLVFSLIRRLPHKKPIHLK